MEIALEPLILSRDGAPRRPRLEGLEGPAIVLVRPQLGQNIGKAARAMLNFGLTDMRLVSPRDGWPNPAAGPAASGADIVLERARGVRERRRSGRRLRACLRDNGAQARPRHAGHHSRGEAGREVHGNDGPSAFLFGAERSGLETEEVALADEIVTVPINPDFRSLNLAQAVILLAYEWSKHRALALPPAKEPRAARAPGELEGLIASSTRRSSQGLFPPARPHAGDQQHDPDHLHQGRLVFTRGKGVARHRPRTGRAAREALIDYAGGFAATFDVGSDSERVAHERMIILSVPWRCFQRGFGALHRRPTTASSVQKPTDDLRAISETGAVRSAQRASA